MRWLLTTSVAPSVTPATVASTDQRIDGQFQVGIGHRHEVVLRPAQRLHALAVARRAAWAI